jgi:hypothetical protein
VQVSANCRDICLQRGPIGFGLCGEQPGLQLDQHRFEISFDKVASDAALK